MTFDEYYTELSTALEKYKAYVQTNAAEEGMPYHTDKGMLTMPAADWWEDFYAWCASQEWPEGEETTP